MKVKAFSIIEIATVLFVASLIVVSLVAGKKMIEASRINAAISQILNIEFATSNFQLQYGFIPGDLNQADAQEYITSDAIYGSGNNNGIIDTTTPLEPILFYYYLGIDNPTIDTALPTVVDEYIVGSNIIELKGSNYGILPYGIQSEGKNYLHLGIESDASIVTAAPFTPIQAESMDRKIDDGLPNIGKLTAKGGSNVHDDPSYDNDSSVDACTWDSNFAGANFEERIYKLITKSKVCMLSYELPSDSS